MTRFGSKSNFGSILVHSSVEANGGSLKLADDFDDCVVLLGVGVENGFFDTNVVEGGVDDRVGVHFFGLFFSVVDEKRRWVVVVAKRVPS